MDDIEPDELNTAICCQRMLIQLVASDSPELYSELQTLGALLCVRFDLHEALGLGELDDLVEATTWHRCAIELLPDNSPSKAAYLVCLGVLFWTRFDRNDEIDDIENAIASWADAARIIHSLGTTPDATALASHDTEFLIRLDAVRESGLLAPAVAALRREPRTGVCRDAARRQLPKLASLACLLQPPVEYSATLSDMHRLQKQFYAYFAARCGWVLLVVADDLDGAIAATSCLALLGSNVGRLETINLVSLVRMLNIRFEHHKSLSDLSTAIVHLDHVSEALETMVSLEPDIGIRLLDACGATISHGLASLPDGATLSKCYQLVAMFHRAIVRYPELTLRAAFLFQAGSLYFSCYGRFNSNTDLDTAIAVYKTAVLITEYPASLKDLGDFLARFSGALETRFRLFRTIEDGRDAVEYLRLAIALAPRDSASDSRHIADLHLKLSFMYHNRFILFGDRDDEEAAVRERLCAAALAPDLLPFDEGLDISDEVLPIHSPDIHTPRHETLATDDINANLPTTLDALHAKTDMCNAHLSLARRFGGQYIISRQSSHRERAVSEFREAIRLSSEQSKLSHINELFWRMREWDQDATEFRRPESLREAIEFNNEALKCRGSAIAEWNALGARVWLCRSWATAISRFGEPDGDYGIVNPENEQIVALQKIMNLVPRLASQSFSISRRYKEMARNSSPVRGIVCQAILLMNPIALQWFEQGRGLVWGQIRNLRTRLKCEQVGERIREDALDDTDHQELGLALERVSNALEAASQTGDAVTARHLETKRDDLLTQIRSLDGFEGFLQPMSIDELLPASHSSAVVCINAWNDENGFVGVIIITHDQKVRLLHTVTGDRRWRQRLNVSLGLQPVRMRKSRPAVTRKDNTAQHVLRDLWQDIVKPVLGMLDIRTDMFPPNGVELPRITWCIAGSLAFLPLHAAGPYDSRSPNAFDLIVSSYTPNLSSILPSRSGAQAAKPNILVVAQPDIAGFSPLPGTRKEADAIQSLFPKESCVRLDGAEGTVEGVFDKLRTHNYVHLACHGEQDSEDPLKSSFILHDGRPLTLEKLMEIAHSSAFVGEVAFLSACETATGDEKVPDEAVHLAAGMLAVGYRSVVATMWSIGDSHAPRVAELFYKTLLAQHEKDGKTDVARALHAAVATLRKEVGVDQIAKWAPFVHYGL